MIGNPFFLCRWESAGAHGGLPKLEGRIPRSHGVQDLYVQPCSLPCYLWHSKCNRRGLDRGRPRRHSIAMALPTMSSSGANLCGHIFGSTTCILFAKKWRILSKFSCFAMEGSHRRLKRVLSNSGGLSLLRGRLGVQVVVVTPLMIAWRRMVGMQPKGHTMGKGPSVYKGTQAIQEDGL